MRTLLHVARISLGAAALVACESVGPVAPPQATVSYTLVAPLCSSIIPVEFYLDSLRVGADTFRINVAGEHTISRAFTTSAGQHTLGARASSIGWSFVWPDKRVTIAPGEVFVDSLPFYCS